MELFGVSVSIYIGFGKYVNPQVCVVDLLGLFARLGSSFSQVQCLTEEWSGEV